MELEEAEDHQSLYYLEKKTEERTNHGKVIAWKKHSHIELWGRRSGLYMI